MNETMQSGASKLGSQMEEAPPVVQETPKEEAKKDPKDKKGKKGENATPDVAPVDEDPNKKPDPNALKFIPGGIRINKQVINMINSWNTVINYALTIRQEGFGVILEDCSIDGCSDEIVDLAFGSAQVSYLNISGFGKHEKSAKVYRFAEIIQL